MSLSPFYAAPAEHVDFVIMRPHDSDSIPARTR